MKNLSAVLKSWRWAEKLTVREAASMIGTSAPTLCRIERGESLDCKTLSKILVWMLAEDAPPPTA